VLFLFSGMEGMKERKKEGRKVFLLGAGVYTYTYSYVMMASTWHGMALIALRGRFCSEK